MSDQPEKKIFVDESWKSQVETEREALRHQEAAPTDTQGKADESAAAEPEAATETDPPLPPPDLTFLAGTIYMQAIIGLGVVPHPGDKKAAVRLNQAKHAIDMLEMLNEKTRGNRTEQESQTIDNMLHELRLAFVSLQQNRP